MLALIYGGSGSGKSAYAENWVMNHKDDKGVSYYLATMQVYDKEGQKRVEKHRHMREGKGFVTAEHPQHIEDILQNPISKKDTVLLECLSNLVANEMFTMTENDSLSDTEDTKERNKEMGNMSMSIKNPEVVVEDIMSGIMKIKKDTGQFCIVGNDIFREGEAPTPEMNQYMQALGELQKRIAALADETIEVVYGIPIVIEKRTKVC